MLVSQPTTTRKKKCWYSWIGCTFFLAIALLIVLCCRVSRTLHHTFCFEFLLLFCVLWQFYMQSCKYYCGFSLTQTSLLESGFWFSWSFFSRCPPCVIEKKKNNNNKKTDRPPRHHCVWYLKGRTSSPSLQSVQCASFYVWTWKGLKLVKIWLSQ